jgi:predicted MPP superfamily phosphohydrolase
MSRGGVLVLALAAGLVTAAVASAMALGRARRRGRLVSRDLVVGGILAGCGLAVMTLVIGPWVGLDVWGVLHVAYRLVFVGIPVTGVVVAGALVGSRRRADRTGTAPTVAATGPAWVLVGLAVVVAPVGMWSSHVAPDELEVVRHRVPVADRQGEAPVRIGVLSDLQTTTAGPHEHEAVDRLLAEHPDVIVVPGDVFQGTTEELTAELDGLRSLIGRLRAPGGVYVVPGDVDAPGHLEALLAGGDARLLRDEVVRIDVGDRRITVAGLSLDVWSAGADEVLADLQADPDPGDVRVVVAHRPDAVAGLHGPRVDLVVAGHTHGGQVALPVIGPPLTLTDLPRHVGAGGLHGIGGSHLFVSKGVGMERGQAPPVRFGVPPDVAVLTLEG